MTAPMPRQALCLGFLALTTLALPCAAAERAAARPKPPVLEASHALPAAPSAKATLPPPQDTSGAGLEARYTAARKAAEKREREWDRKVKQLVKDVCTGC